VQYRKDMLNKECKDYELLTKELAKCGFNIDTCDGVLSVIKTKGNGNGYVGIKYNPDTKTYTQADKISKTEADKIFKVKSKIVTKQIDIEALNEISDDELDGLPF
jgi:hypothetical protein